MNIRLIEKNDYHKSYLELLNQLTPTSKISFSEFSTQLDKIISQNSLIYVTEYNNKIIATATLLMEYKIHNGLTKMAHIEDVVVDKEYRGKNIGKELINMLIERAKLFNCYKIVLNCNKSNIKFYEKCGFYSKGLEMSLYL